MLALKTSIFFIMAVISSACTTARLRHCQLTVEHLQTELDICRDNFSELEFLE